MICLFRDGGWQLVDRYAYGEFAKRGIVIYDSALIGDGVSIGRGTRIGDRSIIASGAVLGRHVVIEPYAVIGWQAVIGHGAKISAKQIVGHGARIENWSKPPFVYILGRNTWPLVWWGQDRIDIGCQSFSISEYLAYGRELAREHGEEDRYEEYLCYVRAVSAIYAYHQAGTE